MHKSLLEKKRRKLYNYQRTRKKIFAKNVALSEKIEEMACNHVMHE